MNILRVKKLVLKNTQNTRLDINYGIWKEVVLDYCVKDCVILYQIMKKFKEMIEDRFEVNVQDCPAITSLAFKIFKANYYDQEKKIQYLY